VIEYPGRILVTAWGDIDARLLVEPPARKAEFVRDRTCFIQHDPIWNTASMSRVARRAS